MESLGALCKVGGRSVFQPQGLCASLLCLEYSSPGYLHGSFLISFRSAKVTPLLSLSGQLHLKLKSLPHTSLLNFYP